MQKGKKKVGVTEEAADRRVAEKYAKFKTPEYIAWRTAVLKRDGYRCQICRRCKPQVRVLQVDHIKAWSKYPECRFDITNGRVLCVRCHKRTPNYSFKALSYINTPEEDAKWVKNEINFWKTSQIKKRLKKVLKNGTKNK